MIINLFLDNYHIYIWSCCWINLRCMMTKMKKKIGKEIISVEKVTKKFGDFVALNDVSSKIYEKDTIRGKIVKRNLLSPNKVVRIIKTLVLI